MFSLARREGERRMFDARNGLCERTDLCSMDPQYDGVFEVSRDVSAISYLAGADTVRLPPLSSFHGRGNLSLLCPFGRRVIQCWPSLALAMDSEVQRKALEQLHGILTNESLPMFKDLENLPYIHVIVREVGRWHSVLPLGVTGPSFISR
ncbi:hypothetical protein BKA70DRAFT_835436 [Coprinopsis sp. MPI-PUGE-AT-0042]|nr:hypothetical protein BKA70DRAFT_835436 [Coprinopsis sp. MPI-PUGE-AT-0042]